MRSVLGKDGRILAQTPEWIASERDVAACKAMAGKMVFSARKTLVEALTGNDGMLGEPKSTSRMTNFFEKGDEPLEIVTSHQQCIRNGGRDHIEANGRQLRESLITAGNELAFRPDFIHVHYDNWAGGFNIDWLISRQHFFGVPIPLWYWVRGSGEIDYGNAIVPSVEHLPVDSSSGTPEGFSEAQHGEPGGFVGEIDITGVWVTSSLSPQVANGWLTDEDLFSCVCPMDVRPQGQDVIRTWLFSSMMRAYLEFGENPWKHAAIFGWTLDLNWKKIPKSKGNVVTLMILLEKHGSDTVRYQTASIRLGVDATFDEQQMEIGHRLAMKVLNASKFAPSMDGKGTPADADVATVTELADRVVLTDLADVVDEATVSFDAYDHAHALELAESRFWSFCDDYLEFVKDRAYSDEPSSRFARVAPNVAANVFLRLLALFIPYATEEVQSWFHTGPIHRAVWPSLEPLRAAATDVDTEIPWVAGGALTALRRVKSENEVSQRTTYVAASIEAAEADRAWLDTVYADLVRVVYAHSDLNASSVTGEAPVAVALHKLNPPEPKKPASTH